MKYLKDILPLHGVLQIRGPENPSVEGIATDSRKLVRGGLFLAIKGRNHDGHQFIDQVIRMGAKTVICEQLPQPLKDEICYVQVNDAAQAAGEIASAWYGHPSRQMSVVGITGTNGKTTIATLLHQLFSGLGQRSGLVSTVKYIIGSSEKVSTHTTPDALHLQEMFSEMVSSGCTHCFMEVSSHAVDQKRIAGTMFRGGVFTNLTHDHLDYHKDFQDYLDAKKKFFDSLPAEAFALINSDDRNGKVMVQNTRARVETYALKSPADYKGKILENHFDGMLLIMDGKEVWTHLIGEFNASNLLAVYGTAVTLGKKPSDVLPLISSFEPVAGRFETLRSEDGCMAIVDYAHTPDALSNVLRTINQLRHPGSSIITLTGAGGNRDRLKRPIMASVAVSLSDRVILTSDNPRHENPTDILSDMEKGVEAADKGKVTVVTDRREAIRVACLMMNPGDILLVAGKGHEDYQEIAGVRHHFSDREEVLKAFELRNKL
jgi:UDP-N-acetylmuramoyl-L-alanyl-D-glutamate--2,6-diaminopimelate ligase